MADAHVTIQVTGAAASVNVNVNPASLQGPKGDPGESGVLVSKIEPQDPEVKVWIKPDGTEEEAGGSSGGGTGVPGNDGEDGGYYVPSVSEAGELSWQASKTDMPAVPAANVRGPAGENGISPKVTVTQISGGHRVDITDADGTKSFEVADGKDGAAGSGSGGTGADGEDGGYYVPEVSTDGELRWNASKVGMPAVAAVNIMGPTGPAGPAGNDGKTPVKGVDYMTEADIAEIVQDVLVALPSAEEASF